MTELGSMKTEISWNLGLTVAGFLTMFAGGIWAFADASNNIKDLIGRMDAFEASATVRRAATDLRFGKIEDRLQPLDNYQYRTTTIEAQVKAINERLDRGFDVQRDSMEALRKSIGDIALQIGLLSQRLDGVVPRKAASAAQAGNVARD